MEAVLDPCEEAHIVWRRAFVSVPSSADIFPQTNGEGGRRSVIQYAVPKKPKKTQNKNLHARAIATKLGYAGGRGLPTEKDGAGDAGRYKCSNAGERTHTTARELRVCHAGDDPNGPSVVTHSGEQALAIAESLLLALVPGSAGIHSDEGMEGGGRERRVAHV
jgi:hypothetical protein